MVNQRRNRKPQLWLWALAGAVFVGVLGLMLACVVDPSLLIGSPTIGKPPAGLSVADKLKAQNDVRTTLVQALAGLAVAGGLVVTYRTYRQNRVEQEQNRAEQQRTYELNQTEQQHAYERDLHARAEQDRTYERELYAKAVEQLGHEKAPVRLGALYSLERLAEDKPERRQIIVDVICAYLRMPFSPIEPEPTEAPEVPAAETERRTEGTGDTWQQERQVRLTARKYSEIVWSPGASAQVSGKMMRHLPQYFRIVTTAQRILAELLHDDRARDKRSTDPPDPRFSSGIRLNLAGATLIDFEFQDGLVADANFHWATFTGNAWFRGTTFTGNALFDATFTGNAIFDGATFTGNALFRGAIFTPYAVFDRATFKGGAEFDWATFNGGAGFDEATFSDARFGEATFSALARFGEATFSALARFDGATFTGDASFPQATFTGDAMFDRATFSGTAGFGMATFSGTAGFAMATFSGIAGFGDATFSGDASFSGAIFSGDAKFYRATFSSDTGFDEATFTGDAVFVGATFKGIAGFYRATFSSIAGFLVATFTGNAVFDEAAFSGLARFGGATFSGLARFNRATFSGDAMFDGPTFSGGENSLSFDQSIVTRPDAQHVWPTGWRLGPDGSGGYTVVRADDGLDTGLKLEEPPAAGTAEGT